MVNLNTASVKVQRHAAALSILLDPHLNTASVKVQRGSGVADVSYICNC